MVSVNHKCPKQDIIFLTLYKPNYCSKTIWILPDIFNANFIQHAAYKYVNEQTTKH